MPADSNMAAVSIGTAPPPAQGAVSWPSDAVAAEAEAGAGAGAGAPVPNKVGRLRGASVVNIRTASSWLTLAPTGMVPPLLAAVVAALLVPLNTTVVFGVVLPLLSLLFLGVVVVVATAVSAFVADDFAVAGAVDAAPAPPPAPTPPPALLVDAIAVCKKSGTEQSQSPHVYLNFRMLEILHID